VIESLRRVVHPSARPTGVTGLTGLAWAFAVLLVIRAPFGVTEGIFPGASMKATSERTLPEDRMTANGLILASNPLVRRSLLWSRHR